MSLHGLGVIGAQVAASIKSNDEKHPATSTIKSPICSIQSTPDFNHDSRVHEFDPSIGAKPYSPFYSHITPTISYEQLTLETKAANRNLSHLCEMEVGGPYSALRGESPRRSKLWDEVKEPRSCMHSLSHRQRMAVKVVIAIITVGSMIGIALGITAAVGGPAWRESTKNAIVE